MFMQRQKRDRQVGEVAAHAPPLLVGVPGGPGRAGVLVAEGDVIVDVVADRLHAAPARRACRRTATRRCPRGGRCRSSGCPAGRPAPRRAGPPPRAAGRRGRPGRACPGPRRRSRSRSRAGRPGPGCGCRRCRTRHGSRWRGSAGRTRSPAARPGPRPASGCTLSMQQHRGRLRALVDDLVAGADPHRCVLQGSLLLVVGSPGPLTPPRHAGPRATARRVRSPPR